MKKSGLGNRLELWIILLVCIISFFVNNEVFVPDIMESRNIIAAREMVYDGHWLVPTLNGELRLEKPPLPTWLTAVAEMASPDNLWLQRAMAGLAATGLIVFFYLAGMLLTRNKRYAFVSAVILCTCYNVILMGRTASWDIYCHAFMMGAIYFFMKAFADRDCSWKSFAWAGLFVGLSFMSKGPVSLYALLLPFLLSYGYIYRPAMRGKWGAVAVTVALFLLVGCLWYVFLYVAHGDEMAYVANKEAGSWMNRNVRPWYYYWSFFLESGVWTVLLLSAMALPLWCKAMRSKKEYLFPLVWMLATVLFLSLFPEKKNRYLLPVMISASYLMGGLLEHWMERLASGSFLGIDKIVYRFNAWLVAGAVAVIPLAAYIFVYRLGYMSFAAWFVCSLFIWGVAVWLIFAALKSRPLWLVGGVLVLFLTAECFMLPFLRNMVNNPEMKSIALTRNLEELKGIPFYYNEKEPIRIELVYAANRKIKPLDLGQVDSVSRALPCVVLTHRPAAEEFPPELWTSVDSVYIGRFDDNRRPKSNRRYSDGFIYHLTLLKKNE